MTLFMMARCIFHYFVFLCIGQHFTSGHLMCWNSSISPAFQSPPLDFCTEFAGFGCCSRQSSEEIKKQYDSLKEKLATLDSETQCLEFLKEQMCQKCSPFSGHMFTFNKKSPIPGLCNGYCQQFYTKCKNMIKHVLQNDLPEDWEDVQKSMNKFCNYFKPGDGNYCFPDLRTNKFIQGGMTNLKSSSKKCLCLEAIQDSFIAPIQSQRPDDGTGRIFVALLSGIIAVYDSQGILISNTFLNISKRIRGRKNNYGDLGFLGFTFHPKFRYNGKMYVVYTMEKTIPERTSIITRFSEFSVIPPSSNEVDLKSERVILDIDIHVGAHVGGQLLFGTDEYFYIFMGDSAPQYDPAGNAQNKSLLFGKVLRIDLESQDGGKSYSVPADNPYVNDPSFRPEIYSYGLRNPWRCGVDLGDVTGKGKGRIICGDVGEHTREEVNLIKKGANYGWNIKEGEGCVPKRTCTKAMTENFEEPLWSYDHGTGLSVVGGAFYRGCSIQHLQGTYIFGDYKSGKLFKIVENEETGKWENEELFMCNFCPGHLTNNYPINIFSIDNDPSGEVFLSASNGLHEKNGKVFRLVKGPNSEDGCLAMKVSNDTTPTSEHIDDSEITDEILNLEKTNVKHARKEYINSTIRTIKNINQPHVKSDNDDPNLIFEESVSKEVFEVGNTYQSTEISVTVIQSGNLHSRAQSENTSTPTTKVTAASLSIKKADRSKINGTIKTNWLDPSKPQDALNSEVMSLSSTDHTVKTSSDVDSSKILVNLNHGKIKQNVVVTKGFPHSQLDTSDGKTFKNSESGNRRNCGESNFSIMHILDLVAVMVIGFSLRFGQIC